MGLRLARLAWPGLGSWGLRSPPLSPACHLRVGSAPESWPWAQRALLSLGLPGSCARCRTRASPVTKDRLPQLLGPGRFAPAPRSSEFGVPLVSDELLTS